MVVVVGIARALEQRSHRYRRHAECSCERPWHSVELILNLRVLSVVSLHAKVYLESVERLKGHLYLQVLGVGSAHGSDCRVALHEPILVPCVLQPARLLDSDGEQCARRAAVLSEDAAARREARQCHTVGVAVVEREVADKHQSTSSSLKERRRSGRILVRVLAVHSHRERLVLLRVYLDCVLVYNLELQFVLSAVGIKRLKLDVSRVQPMREPLFHALLQDYCLRLDKRLIALRILLFRV